VPATVLMRSGMQPACAAAAAAVEEAEASRYVIRCWMLRHCLLPLLKLAWQLYICESTPSLLALTIDGFHTGVRTWAGGQQSAREGLINVSKNRAGR
jgi:hypothetical protein